MMPIGKKMAKIISPQDPFSSRERTDRTEEKTFRQQIGIRHYDHKDRTYIVAKSLHKKQ